MNLFPIAFALMGAATCILLLLIVFELRALKATLRGPDPDGRP